MGVLSLRTTSAVLTMAAWARSDHSVPLLCWSSWLAVVFHPAQPFLSLHSVSLPAMCSPCMTCLTRHLSLRSDVGSSEALTTALAYHPVIFCVLGLIFFITYEKISLHYLTLVYTGIYSFVGYLPPPTLGSIINESEGLCLF